MQLHARDLHRTTDHAYLLGHSAQEQRRLAEQGLMLQPITERLFRDAGLRRGMRVLDVGCGVGDVSCLAAEIVGSHGAVVGVDFAGAVLSTARSRAASRGLTWARFIEADITQVSLTDLGSQRFDAVVGRLVLMYQTDPAAVLRRLSAMVRPGGVVAFLEGIALPPLAWPHRPLYAHTIERLLATFDRSGAKVDMGLRLHHAVRRGGPPRAGISARRDGRRGTGRARISVVRGAGPQHDPGNGALRGRDRRGNRYRHAGGPTRGRGGGLARVRVWARARWCLGADPDGPCAP